MNQLLSPAAAVGAAGTFGVADFIGGVAGRKSSPPSVAIGVETVGFVALPLVLWLLPFRADAFAAALAFAGGALGGLGLIAFYRAMAMNLIGVVAPVTAVVAAALPVGAGLIFGGERLHAGQVAGIAAGLIAIALINGGGEVTHTARAAVGLAVLAGIGFGMFFILYHRASGAGATAFVSGRLGSALAAVGFALVSRVPLVPRREVWPLLGIGGTLDGLGVVLYMFATFNGLLSLSALLTSFYPAFTVLCARVFLHERMALIQAGGAVLALVAVVLIAAA
ncbi:MAG TPA: DMT family transporter [Candidatus Dormibacteraeota bacterium]|nr:DMT family transporter [Candidatus Dormibacteraeota bacterium]